MIKETKILCNKPVTFINGKPIWFGFLGIDMMEV